MGKFQELRVWERSKDFAVHVYKLTRKGDFRKDIGYISEDEFKYIENECKTISGMLGRLIKARTNKTFK